MKVFFDHLMAFVEIRKAHDDKFQETYPPAVRSRLSNLKPVNLFVAPTEPGTE